MIASTTPLKAFLIFPHNPLKGFTIEFIKFFTQLQTSVDILLVLFQNLDLILFYTVHTVNVKFFLLL